LQKKGDTMKKTGLFLLGLLFATYSFSQKIIKDEAWGAGEVKEYNGHKIKRISGENNGVNITNITYQSQDDLIKEAKDNPRLEGDKEKTKIAEYKKYAQGGLVLLFIQREGRDNANTSNFSIAVKDSDGKEVFKKKLKDTSARKSSDGAGWYSTAHGYIGKKVKTPFIVEIEEHLPDGSTETFVFEIIE
jgi:hypothetical protein